MGCGEVIGPRDIIAGNPKVTLLFLAEIFNTKHGLEDLSNEEYVKATAYMFEYYCLAGKKKPSGTSLSRVKEILQDNIEEEEKAFRIWINSLGIPGVFINSLFEDLRNGLVLCKLIHRINDKVVEWDDVELEPKNIFMMGTNCLAALRAAEKLKLRVTGIDAADICDANQKAVRLFVWALARLYHQQIIGSKTEQNLLDWVSKVERVTSFDDPKFADGRILIKLVEAIEPRIIDWALVSKGFTYKAKLMNAKYAISLVRKLGVTVFIVPDDIPSLNARMIFIFLC